MRFTRSLAVLLLLVLTSAARASILIVPPDDDLIDAADAIVVARVVDLNGAFELNGDIVTNIDVMVESRFKGGIADKATIRVRELGGVVGREAMFVSESASYWKDNRALLFLTRHDDGTWSTWGASLGKFDFVQDADGRKLVVRWATQSGTTSLWTPEGQPHEEQLRDADLFQRYIARRLLGRFGPDRPVKPNAVEDEAGYFVDAPKAVSKPEGWDPLVTAAYPPSAYTSGTFRWDRFDKGQAVQFFASGTQPNYDSIGAAQRALAAWTNDTGSNVDYRYAGTNSLGFVKDNVNTIVYNNSTDVPAGAIGYAKWYANADHVYKGETFYSISEGDVVIRSGLSVSTKVFEEAVTHELGHTLGFRHSDQGTPSSIAAVMKSSLSGQYGSTLGPWDIEAVRTVYTSTGTTQPTVGTPAGLVARATSTSSISISWSAASNATEYELERATVIGQFTTRARVTGTSFTDTGLAANTTYLYRVRAVSSSTTSTYSNIDHATTIIFTSDPLQRGMVIRAIHLTEIRIAVNAMRVAAALASRTWTDPSPLGVRVKAVHITELRSALTAALSVLGKSASFTDPTLGSGMPIKAVHFQELRNLVK